MCPLCANCSTWPLHQICDYTRIACEFPSIFVLYFSFCLYLVTRQTKDKSKYITWSAPSFNFFSFRSLWPPWHRLLCSVHVVLGWDFIIGSSLLDANFLSLLSWYFKEGNRCIKFIGSSFYFKGYFSHPWNTFYWVLFWKVLNAHFLNFKVALYQLRYGLPFQKFIIATTLAVTNFS